MLDVDDRAGLDHLLTHVGRRGRSLWLDPSVFFSRKTMAVAASTLNWLKPREVWAPRLVVRYLGEPRHSQLNEFLSYRWGGPKRRPSRYDLGDFDLQELRTDYEPPGNLRWIQSRANEMFRRGWDGSVISDLVTGSITTKSPILAFSRSELALSQALQRLGGFVLRAGAGVKGGLSRAHKWKAEKLYPYLKRKEITVGVGLVGASLVYIFPPSGLILGAIIIG